jgi:hypothetical protein
MSIQNKLKEILYVSALWLATSATFAQQSDLPGNTENKPEPIIRDIVVVKGRFPGPPLWKISHGEHALWIFGHINNVPKELEWNAGQVETVLAKSQQYLPMWDLHLDGVPRKDLALPDGTSLADVVPPPVYERYLSIKSKHFPEVNDLERLRPIVAGPSLLGGIYRRAGLTSGSGVLKKIDSLVRRQHGVKRIKVNSLASRMSKANKRAGAVNILNGATAQQELACFEAALEQVEQDIAVLQQRANAWAQNQMYELRTLTEYTLGAPTCQVNMSSTDSAEEAELKEKTKQTVEEWLAAAEKALQSNVSTFAVVPIEKLLNNDDALLSHFRQKGYVVNNHD